MNTAGLITRFLTGTYTVKRHARVGTATYGVIDTGAETEFTIRASVSPARGADLLKLPQGRSVNETKMLFTTTRLYIGDTVDPYEADTLVINGAEHELVHVEVWDDPRGGAAMYKVLAVLS